MNGRPSGVGAGNHGLPRNARIVIFVKAPRPGFAKTRLIPALGADGASDLARRLLVHTVRTALAAAIGPVELCVTPTRRDPAWESGPISSTLADMVHWSDQGGGDLGERLARAARRVTENGESILLIGTDCSALGVSELRQAGSALRDTDAALLPTADGGYALLGLKRFDPSLFEDIAWSTDGVAMETTRRLGKLRWSVRHLPVLHDIDVPADLDRLPHGWLEAGLV